VLIITECGVRYGRVGALSGVSLDVNPGEIVSVLGPNGAGKTTLGRAIMGLISHSGTVTLDGRDISRLRADKRCHAGLAYVPSTQRVFPGVTVREHIRLCAGKEFPARWDFLVERFPVLAEKHAQRAGDLSGGQQQLLSIARALACAPRYVVLDEPSAGLAPVVVDRVFDAIHDLPDDIGVLLLEQNAAMGIGLSKRAVVLSGGEIRLRGSSADLEGRPEIEAMYLGVSADEASSVPDHGGPAPALARQEKPDDHDQL
jgi:branched-chain amino acid transport system ATP-binding protein